MKQTEKLQDAIKNPAKYNIRTNTRIYNQLQQLARLGVACTGYSDRRTKRVNTLELANTLTRIGLKSFVYGNKAPRGGASGEFVEFTGRLFWAIHKKYKAWENENKDKYKYFYDLENAYNNEILFGLIIL